MWFWLFLISVAVNVFLMFYVRWFFKTLETINVDILSLVEKINTFSEHLSSIHEMEMFYGDETLRSLMQHSSELSKDILNLDLLINTDPNATEEDAQIEKKA